MIDAGHSPKTLGVATCGTVAENDVLRSSRHSYPHQTVRHCWTLAQHAMDGECVQFKHIQTRESVEEETGCNRMYSLCDSCYLLKTTTLEWPKLQNHALVSRVCTQSTTRHPLSKIGSQVRKHFSANLTIEALKNIINPQPHVYSTPSIF